jgi:hypothetical protein
MDRSLTGTFGLRGMEKRDTLPAPSERREDLELRVHLS